MQLGIGLNLANPQKPGGFSPADLSGLEVWLKTADIGTAPGWVDSSGNDYNAQNGATPPTLNAGVSAVFDGSDDYLTFDAAQFTTGHLFIVTTPASSGTVLGGIFGEWEGTVSLRRAVSADDGWFNGNSDDLGYTGDGNVIRINGVETTTHAAGTKAIVEIERATPFTISPIHAYHLGNAYSAGGRAYKGTIFEVIVYAAALSAGNATNVRNYLAAAHGITL